MSKSVSTAAHTGRIAQTTLWRDKSFYVSYQQGNWVNLPLCAWRQGEAPNETSLGQLSGKFRLPQAKLGSFAPARCQNNTSLLDSLAVLGFAKVFCPACLRHLAWQLEPALPTVWPFATYLMTLIWVTNSCLNSAPSAIHTPIGSRLDRPTLHCALQSSSPRWPLPSDDASLRATRVWAIQNKELWLAPVRG